MKKVMLAEDEEFILQGIRCIIDWEEISMKVVSIARNGREALEMFQKEPVDILVTDVEMPQMNGLDLIKEIRRIQPKTRCIILSGYDEFEYARSALRLDVEEYILKPVNEDQLRQALVRAAEHLDEIDRKKIGSMEDKIGWHKFLNGKLDGNEMAEFYQVLPVIGRDEQVCGAIMKIDTKSLENNEGIQVILMETQKLTGKVKTIYLSPDTLFLLLYSSEETIARQAAEIFGGLQYHLESRYGIMTFLPYQRP